MPYLVSTAVAEPPNAAIQTEVLTQTTASWDGATYKSYPSGQPQITVLKITIAPHTVMSWHSHPVPNAGYILAGDLTIEKPDGKKSHFTAGQAVPETVNSVHRGVSGSEPLILVVFYAGASGIPLSVTQGPADHEGR